MANVVLDKLFDVRNGNDADRNGTQYPHAILIAFKDSAAKAEVIEAFAKMGSYQDTINGQPNPQSKNQFFRHELQRYIRDRVVAARDREARESIVVDETDLP